MASYHAFNIVVHILAALTLFGLVRLTLNLPALRARFEGAATALALATALIWEVHPLQTESVTYIIQRQESLAGLFYLLTLYCVARGALSERPRPFDSAQGAPRLCSGRWYTAAFAACVLGMLSKQTVAAAPLAVFLYDWIFLSGSFLDTLRRRWPVYLALAATWLLLIPSFAPQADAQHASAGFQVGGITPIGLRRDAARRDPALSEALVLAGRAVPGLQLAAGEGRGGDPGPARLSSEHSPRRRRRRWHCVPPHIRRASPPHIRRASPRGASSARGSS